MFLSPVCFRSLDHGNREHSVGSHRPRRLRLVHAAYLARRHLALRAAQVEGYALRAQGRRRSDADAGICFFSYPSCMEVVSSFQFLKVKIQYAVHFPYDYSFSAPRIYVLGGLHFASFVELKSVHGVKEKVIWCNRIIIPKS